MAAIDDIRAATSTDAVVSITGNNDFGEFASSDIVVSIKPAASVSAVSVPCV